jgi:hypothetical protein
LLAAVALEERIERALADARRADGRLLAERLRLNAGLLQAEVARADFELLGARVTSLRTLQAQQSS